MDAIGLFPPECVPFLMTTCSSFRAEPLRVGTRTDAASLTLRHVYRWGYCACWVDKQLESVVSLAAHYEPPQRFQVSVLRFSLLLVRSFSGEFFLRLCVGVHVAPRDAEYSNGRSLHAAPSARRAGSAVRPASSLGPPQPLIQSVLSQVCAVKWCAPLAPRA